MVKHIGGKMDIYNKEPIEVLVDLTKGLMFDNNGKLLKNGIPIYKETMHEEPKDVPQSYILLRSQITDTSEIHGDGKSMVRDADCDIILITKGYADDTNDLHNINKKKIKDYLVSQDIEFQEFNLGYDDGIKSTQHTFSLGVKYLG